MLNVLADHWETIIQIIVFVAFGVGIYYKVTDKLNELKKEMDGFQENALEHWKRQDKEFSRIEGRFDDHVNDPLPHVSCPAHGQAIHDIAERLDRIQTDIAHVRDDAKQTLMLLINGLPKGAK